MVTVLLLSRWRLYILAFFFFCFLMRRWFQRGFLTQHSCLTTAEALWSVAKVAILTRQLRGWDWASSDLLCETFSVGIWKECDRMNQRPLKKKKKKRWSKRRMCSHTMSRIKVWWELCVTKKNHIVRLLRSLTVFTFLRHDVRPITLQIFKLPLPFSNRV